MLLDIDCRQSQLDKLLSEHAHLLSPTIETSRKPVRLEGYRSIYNWGHHGILGKSPMSTRNLAWL